MGQCCSNDDHAPDNFNFNRSTNRSDKHHESTGFSPPGLRHEVFRFFMVGMGSAGKSTVIKQLQKLCHDRPEIYRMFDEEWTPLSHTMATHDKERYRRIIRKNVFDSIAVLEHYVQEWSLRPSSSSSSAASSILDVASSIRGPDMTIEKETVEALIELIQDEAILTALGRRSEMTGVEQLADGAVNFLRLDKMREIFSPDYSPSEDDVVHSRSPTTGIHDYRFGIRDMRIQIHDIGGQKVERGKLLSYIQNWVAADRSGYRNFILYVVSTSEYNIPHPEHNKITLMDESLMMLQNILELPPIQNVGLMIFFNKDDVFKQKVALCKSSSQLREDTLRHLGGHMKEADKALLNRGETPPHEGMQKAIAKKFTEAIKEVKAKRYKGVYHKFTCAVDTKMMSSLFNTIENELINYTIDTASFLFA